MTFCFLPHHRSHALRLATQLVSLGALLAVSLAAQAQLPTLPGAQFTGSATGTPPLNNTAGTLSGTVCSPDGTMCTGTDTMSAGYTGGAGYGTASGASSLGTIAQSGGTILYQFEVVGAPGTFNPVQLMFTASGTTSIGFGGAAYTAAEAALQTSNRSGLFDVNACTADNTFLNGSCSQPSSFDVAHPFTYTSNFVGYVFLNFGGEGDGETYSASVDPQISFAAGFNSSGYQLIFSPDAPGSPPAPVPLPNSVVLMLFGLAGLLAVARVPRRTPRSSAVE
jgi:hypothetical protein